MELPSDLYMNCRSSNDTLTRADTITSVDTKLVSPRGGTGGSFFQLSRHKSATTTTTYKSSPKFFALFLSPLDHDSNTQKQMSSNSVHIGADWSPVKQNIRCSNLTGDNKADPMTPELRELGLASDC